MIRIPIGMKVMYFSFSTKFIKTETIIEMFATRIIFWFVLRKSVIWLSTAIKAKPIDKLANKTILKMKSARIRL